VVCLVRIVPIQTLVGLSGRNLPIPQRTRTLVAPNEDDMRYINMNDLLFFNTAKAKKKKIISKVIQILIIAIWFSIMVMANFQNIFWNYFQSTFHTTSKIPLFYKVLTFCFIYIYFGWLLSLLFVKILLGRLRYFVNTSECSFKFLIITFSLSLLINSNSDTFLLILHFMIFFFISYKLWFVIEKTYYDFNPKLERISDIDYLKNTIIADKNRSEFILLNIVINEGLAWLCIDYKENYIFSDNVIENLKNNNVPSLIINEIECLKGFEYESREVFLSNLIKKLDSKELFKYQSIILQCTDLVNKYDFSIEFIGQNEDKTNTYPDVNHILRSCFNKDGYSNSYSNLFNYFDKQENHYNLFYKVPYDIYKSNS